MTADPAGGTWPLKYILNEMIMDWELKTCSETETRI